MGLSLRPSVNYRHTRAIIDIYLYFHDILVFNRNWDFVLGQLSLSIRMLRSCSGVKFKAEAWQLGDSTLTFDATGHRFVLRKWE